MTSKLMDLLQRKSLHHSILCKFLVRLEDFCLLFSFSLKHYKYFFSILLSHCFRHWDGYITTTDKLKWLVWGYRNTEEQKDWWLKRENCFKLFRDSFSFPEFLRAIEKSDEWIRTLHEQSDGVRPSVSAMCIFLFWSLSSKLVLFFLNSLPLSV